MVAGGRVAGAGGPREKRGLFLDEGAGESQSLFRRAAAGAIAGKGEPSGRATGLEDGHADHAAEDEQAEREKDEPLLFRGFQHE